MLRVKSREIDENLKVTGITYNETADIWSNTCMIFEMLTGNFLFDLLDFLFVSLELVLEYDCLDNFFIKKI